MSKQVRSAECPSEPQANDLTALLGPDVLGYWIDILKPLRLRIEANEQR
jgi:hypothetical protein